ncbi:MAG: hypothetical protein HOK72_08645, partial [Flavobacteriales bacterium]|nr:hypothetical protein [Flavobacteriales bacterium]
GIITGASPFVLDGTTVGGFNTQISVTDPTANRTITLQDGTGTLAFLSDLAGNGGIYGGNGTVPSSTAVTLTDNLNFDANTLYLDGANNSVGIGTVPISLSQVQLQMDRSNGDLNILAITNGTGTSGFAQLSFLNYAGTDPNNPGATPDGAVLGKLEFGGAKGGGGITYSDGAYIQGKASQAWSAAGTGTDLIISTTLQNGASPTERMRFSSNGGIGIGTLPNINTILDVASTTKGVLLPRLTDIEETVLATALAATDNGMLIYNTTSVEFKYWNGSAFIAVGSTGSDGIYSGSGSLSGATTVTGGANTLDFTTTAIDGFSVDGPTFSVDGANDRVGIGTSSPMFKTHIVDETSAILMVHTYENNTEAAIALVSTGGDVGAETAPQAGDIIGTMFFMGYTPGDGFMEAAMIRAEAVENYSSSGSGSVLDFRTTSIGSTAAVDRMRIDNSGNVGIGTAPNTNALLDVESNTKGVLLPRLTDIEETVLATALAATDNGMLIYNTTSVEFKYWNGSAFIAVGSTGSDGIYSGSGSLSGATTVTGGANTLDFTTTAVDGFSVDGTTFSVDGANDRVGIGTSAPEYELHLAKTGADLSIGVQQAGAGSPVLGFVSSEGTVALPTATPDNSTLGKVLFAGYDGASFQETGSIEMMASENWGAGSTGSKLEFSTTKNGSPAATPRMTIDNEGKVGIGTSSPNATLHLKPSTANGLRIDTYGAGAGQTGEIQLVDMNGSYTGFKSPDILVANTIYTLPTEDGTNGQFLQTDGSQNLSWQNPGAGACLANMSAVNDQYCIDDNEQAVPADFWGAAIGCIGADKRLCTLSEWFYACQTNPAGWNVGQGVDDFEWVEFGGSNSGTVVGNGACDNTSTFNFTSNHVYRCCYSR